MQHRKNFPADIIFKGVWIWRDYYDAFELDDTTNNSSFIEDFFKHIKIISNGKLLLSLNGLMIDSKISQENH